MNPASSGFFCDNQLEMTMIDAVKRSFKNSRYDILFPKLNIWPGTSKITLTSQSQIFCNFTQFYQIGGTAVICETMIQMIMDKLTFCIGDGFLDSVELLGDIKARLFKFKHRHNTSQMAFSPFQPVDDLRVTCMCI